MKKIVSIIICVSLVFVFFGCGDSKTINGHTYGTYGLFNQSDMKNENIQYRVIVGNVVWSCILVETVIAPIYFLGFSLYEPVGPKNDTVKGTIN